MKEKGQANRQRIVEAANELFYHKGFNQTSFAEVAEKSGIPKGNFYYYFKSKDELLASVIDDRLAQTKTMLASWESGFQYRNYACTVLCRFPLVSLKASFSTAAQWDHSMSSW
ncbi:TetR/AcrR family transcriptional regulator [Candidatus Reidiella endopervernicosa]|uniref:TetR/AcrR family transcriptional regulator n=1 Tax=Candidatus Reidiella endopervernicosa TaxID=2738883 RepID=A0A6N0HS85_9GAMM|nr:TetR/AcrR family transcriptional regulator [Candidatus Reidiella endopervernicosa]QKQ25233.1 TetR/AcrR family transcriptional regulator [Candidatus Reidiella endopervernicosa]